MFKQYTQKMEEIKQIEVSFKNKITYFLFSLIVAIISMSGLICLSINLLLFRDFQKLLSFLIATFVIAIYLIYEILYLKCITNKKVEGLSVIYITNTFVVAIVIYMFLIFLYFIGVI